MDPVDCPWDTELSSVWGKVSRIFFLIAVSVVGKIGFMHGFFIYYSISFVASI